jgi:mono/diheme cytochrome c family protein
MPLLPRAAMIAVLSLGACAPHDPRADRVLALKGDAARGEALYRSVCATCHKSEKGWAMTFDLLGHAGVMSMVIDGVPKSPMPAFAAWPDQSLADVHAYMSRRGR